MSILTNDESNAVLCGVPTWSVVRSGHHHIRDDQERVSQTNGEPHPHCEPVAASHHHNYQHCCLKDSIHFHVEMCFG